MTVAALEAEVLRDCLRGGDRDLPRRFYRKSAKKVHVAWRTAVGSDLMLPQVPGRRPLFVRVMNRYMDRVLNAAETDPLVAQQFFRVVQMLDGPSALIRPHIVGRIARASMRRKRRLQPVDRIGQRSHCGMVGTARPEQRVLEPNSSNRREDMGALDVLGPIVEFLTQEGDEQVCVMRAVIPAGVTVPLHSHDDFEDFYILAGAHQVLVHGDDGPQWRDVHVGDYVRVPADAPHALRNVSDEPAVDLMITTARMGKFFREVGRPSGSPAPTAQEVARFVEIAKAYGYLLATPEENAAVGITLPSFAGDEPLNEENTHAAI
jgi:quercetin dioxygenase-like cupin family protein